MNYEHEWEQTVTLEPSGDRLYKCKACQLEDFERDAEPQKHLRQGPCPERIVQEVVRRLAIELQRANVVPAKRKDRRHP